MWKYIFSIAALVIGLWVSGQNPAPQQPPKPRVDFRPYELKLGVNVIRLARSASGSDLITHEVEAAMAMHHYIVVGNFGIEEHTRGESFDYENKGSYYRIGIDRNFAKDRESGNTLTLGLRYARANFSDQIAFTADQGFGEQDYFLENDNLTARWVEVAFGLRGKVVSNLYMGFTMRWQFLRKVNGEGELKTYDIPGFGKTKRQNSTAFDYYLMWRIPFEGR